MMTTTTRLKATTSTVGLLLTMLGILLPHCFPVAIAA